MADRPILFSAPMVRALYDGRKTQTRRVIKDVPMHSPEYDRQWHANVLPPGGACPDAWSWWSGPPHGQSCYHIARIPYARGDRLWAREAHAISANPDLPFWYREGHEEARASGPRVDVKWRPSIHMPRWASRLTLIVEGVKVERLQDISEDDARAEGAPDYAAFLRRFDPAGNLTGGETPEECQTRLCWPQRWFADLWRSLHGPGAWDANPWVAAITFRVVKANIDAPGDDPARSAGIKVAEARG